MPNSTSANQLTEAEQHILDAAKKVFIKRGFAGTRTQEIADEAGINKSLLHYYFRSKDKLFKAIFQESLNKIEQEILSILDSDLELFEKIRFFFREYISFLQDNRFLPGFIIHEVQTQPEVLSDLFREAGIRPPENFVKQIKQEVEQKNILPVEPDELVINMLSLSIFPILAAPLLKNLLQQSEEDFEKMLEKRKKDLPEWIINNLKV